MVERNDKGKPPPIAIYRALRQLEELLASAEGEPSAHTHGPDTLVGRKRHFLKTSLLVRKQWQHLPDTYFAPLLRLAIYEPDPSLNREFIEPALRAFGYPRVQEALLEYLDQGTLRERLVRRAHAIGHGFRSSLIRALDMRSFDGSAMRISGEGEISSC